MVTDRIRKPRARRAVRVATLFLAVAAVATGAFELAAIVGSAAPVFADGPTPCTVGGPPFPYAGFCATYSGANTWYGSYGPGFPTDEGWGFCADPPASGGDYPAPDYDYVGAAAPGGAQTSGAAALGFAFSEAQARGWWAGSPGAFTADQAAVAGKLLYDSVVWASPVPAMDPGVLAAYGDLDGLYGQAAGLSGAPTVDVGLADGLASFTGEADVRVQVSFPGSNSAFTGLALQISATGATLDSPSGPTDVTVATDSRGEADIPIDAAASGPVTLTVTVVGGLGQPGMQFLTPTARVLSAQGLAAFLAPTPLSVTDALTSLPTTGTVSIAKSGDDTAYYPVAGAVFQVLADGTIKTELTTGPDGSTPASEPLAAGSYVVHEETAPPGYEPASDQTVTVIAGQNTTVTFADLIAPATLTIAKVDQDSGAPLEGAVFEVFYDALDDGSFGHDLGVCTTDASGTCTPPGDDGASAELPGHYRVIETAAPAGYGIPTPATQEIDVAAGADDTVTFGDPRLVQAVFQKSASGNVNPAELSLAGTRIEVSEGTPAGKSVALCTTDADGSCGTGTVLVSGQPYCWAELAPPPGLAGGAHGCFTAENGQADQPIAVHDEGEFVAVEAKKVDAADPSVGLAGAQFDLYRVESAAFGSLVARPEVTPDETKVASATTDVDGVASFPLQFPGYAYCAVEAQPPPNYDATTSQQCTPVLEGTTTVPPAPTTLVFKDIEQTVALTLRKFNALDPQLTIDGATYDLYVEGAAPPSGVPGQQPDDVTTEQGDTWFARGTTGADGTVAFTVPAGRAWCVLEVTAPADYTLDPALHCTPVLTRASPADATTIAIAESLATVHLSAYKYNSRQPDTVIPGATYELVAEGSSPPGAPAAAPAAADVPSGDEFWALGTTDAAGVLTFAVPAGYSWCLHELAAPPQYEPDPGFHCTAVLTADSEGAATTIAVPETPVSDSLAFTGFPTLWMGLVGGAAAAVGGGTLLVERLRRRRPIRRHRSR